MKKEEREREKKITRAGFLQEPSQDLRVPFYETLSVGYFRCVVFLRKKKKY